MGVSVDFEDTDLFVLERFDERKAAGRDRDGLPGYGVPILHARSSDILMRNSQAAGQMADELFRRDFAFFDAKEEKIADFRRGVSRNFVNNEVIGMGLAESPGSRQVAADPGEGNADNEIRGGVRRCVLHCGEYIGCRFVRRRQQGRIAVGHFQETGNESVQPEVAGSTCLAE